MEEFSKTEPLFIKEKAMMCIEFIYDKNSKNIPRGDHDNKEVKQVIDAIAFDQIGCKSTFELPVEKNSEE